MKKILVPTDFSNCADAAAAFAIQMAKKAEAELCFMHLEPTPVDWVALSKDQEKQYPETAHAIGRARGALKEWVHQATTKGVKAEQSLVLSSERAAVFDELEGHHYDFIVMGSHGKKGFKERLMGSNALYILRNAKVPVLVIKQPVSEPITDLLFISNFREVSDAIFRNISQLASVLDAHLHLLLIRTDYDFQDPDKDLKYLNEVKIFDEEGIAYTKHTVDAPSVEEGLAEFLAEQPISMIAIGTHGRSELRQLFVPSIAERIVQGSKTPVLSMRLGV